MQNPQPLINQSRSRNFPRVQEAACFDLASANAFPPNSHPSIAVALLERAMQGLDDHRVRLTAIDGLTNYAGASPKLIPALTKLLNDTDVEVAIAGSFALPALGLSEHFAEYALRDSIQKDDPQKAMYLILAAQQCCQESTTIADTILSGIVVGNSCALPLIISLIAFVPTPQYERYSFKLEALLSKIPDEIRDEAEHIIKKLRQPGTTGLNLSISSEPSTWTEESNVPDLTGDTFDSSPWQDTRTIIIEAIHGYRDVGLTETVKKLLLVQDKAELKKNVDDIGELLLRILAPSDKVMLLDALKGCERYALPLKGQIRQLRINPNASVSHCARHAYDIISSSYCREVVPPQ